MDRLGAMQVFVRVAELGSFAAVAQQLGSSGEDFLLACAIGYEIVARIGSACDMRMSIHPHGTYGVVGAAVAAAKLAGLGPGPMREVISLAGSAPMAARQPCWAMAAMAGRSGPRRSRG